MQYTTCISVPCEIESGEVPHTRFQLRRINYLPRASRSTSRPTDAVYDLYQCVYDLYQCGALTPTTIFLSYVGFIQEKFPRLDSNSERIRPVSVCHVRLNQEKFPRLDSNSEGSTTFLEPADQLLDQPMQYTTCISVEKFPRLDSNSEGSTTFLELADQLLDQPMQYTTCISVPCEIESGEVPHTRFQLRRMNYLPRASRSTSRPIDAVYNPYQWEPADQLLDQSMQYTTCISVPCEIESGEVPHTRFQLRRMNYLPRASRSTSRPTDAVYDLYQCEPADQLLDQPMQYTTCISVPCEIESGEVPHTRFQLRRMNYLPRASRSTSRSIDAVYDAYQCGALTPTTIFLSYVGFIQEKFPRLDSNSERIRPASVCYVGLNQEKFPRLDSNSEGSTTFLEPADQLLDQSMHHVRLNQEKFPTLDSNSEGSTTFLEPADQLLDQPMQYTTCISVCGALTPTTIFLSYVGFIQEKFPRLDSNSERIRPASVCYVGLNQEKFPRLDSNSEGSTTFLEPADQLLDQSMQYTTCISVPCEIESGEVPHTRFQLRRMNYLPRASRSTSRPIDAVYDLYQCELADQLLDQPMQYTTCISVACEIQSGEVPHTRFQLRRMNYLPRASRSTSRPIDAVYDPYQCGELTPTTIFLSHVRLNQEKFPRLDSNSEGSTTFLEPADQLLDQPMQYTTCISVEKFPRLDSNSEGSTTFLELADQLLDQPMHHVRLNQEKFPTLDSNSEGSTTFLEPADQLLDQLMQYTTCTSVPCEIESGEVPHTRFQLRRMNYLPRVSRSTSRPTDAVYDLYQCELADQLLDQSMQYTTCISVPCEIESGEVPHTRFQLRRMNYLPRASRSTSRPTDAVYDLYQCAT
ncbi:hypothetical protein C8J55DRAFT_493115 [Lentinula edodes]|uniref:Uncharacterized protein n=1 Tax=Lentinula lateritia TaxID=40482 RepID=A0A9W9DF44_9AGAR|nr:hypothetical protein C8J55DRAFT_493115 [Lentinula edodes]